MITVRKCISQLYTSRKFNFVSVTLSTYITCIFGELLFMFLLLVLFVIHNKDRFILTLLYSQRGISSGHVWLKYGTVNLIKGATKYQINWGNNWKISSDCETSIKVVPQLNRFDAFIKIGTIFFNYFLN